MSWSHEKNCIIQNSTTTVYNSTVILFCCKAKYIHFFTNDFWHGKPISHGSTAGRQVALWPSIMATYINRGMYYWKTPCANPCQLPNCLLGGLTVPILFKKIINNSKKVLPGNFIMMTLSNGNNFLALLALCAGNSPGTGEFSAQKPVTRSFDVFSDLRLNKRLSQQSWGWWFETPSRSLWRHCKVNILII